ncbi:MULTISPECIES: hypothetical protein [Legionella]|uniref:Uncharacterized protein n=1 Tax=Legionella drozanskii LLAP-1 TaxID=1212489 RepID=A0A0W0T0Y7_9GAMM|nr:MULTISPECIES: hypothetical protein [Legionella]KTC89236.1 hypothetical protein Ldro_0725 [Legionella drozanskii LLAP-1]PJE13386.1 MAG: hypothetical protein CK430_06420 [Legionella sp.]
MKADAEMKKILEKDKARKEGLIELDIPYKKEKKTERIISKFWTNLSKSGLERKSFKEHDFGQFRSRYLSKSEQLDSRLTIDHDGKFIRTNGKTANGLYIYIVNKNDEIVALPNMRTLHHSYVANGKKIKGAGFLLFEKGILKEIDNNSGHYKPTTEQMINLLTNVCKQLPYDVRFKDYSHQKEKVLHQYSLNEFVKAVESDAASNELISIAEKIPYRVTQSPMTTVIEERLHFVKTYVKDLNEKVQTRLKLDDEPFERVYEEISDDFESGSEKEVSKRNDSDSEDENISEEQGSSPRLI